MIHQKQWKPIAKNVVIRDGIIHWSDKIKLPLRPMIGTIGTATARENLLNSKGGPYGGNMDVQEVTNGATIYLPVEVKGALLHIGDVHAIMGDGEINDGGGIEIRAQVTLRATVQKRPENMKWVRMENEDYIMTICCERSTDEAFFGAANEMLMYMEEYGFTVDDAYMLMAQVMEARCTQFVNPTRTYICKMPKKYL